MLRAQAVLGWAKHDYSRELNTDGVLRYLDWITQDACFVIKRLLLPDGLDEPTDAVGLERWVAVEASARPSWLVTMRKACPLDASAVKAAVSKIGGPLHPDYSTHVHERFAAMDTAAGSGDSAGETVGWRHVAENLRAWIEAASSAAKERAASAHSGADVKDSLVQCCHCCLLLCWDFLNSCLLLSLDLPM